MAEYLKQQITEIIAINSEFPEKSLRSVWSSYDKNVHKIVVPVTTQSGVTFEMSEITNVEVYLSFSKGSYGPFEGKVEDAAQKTVSFAVPEEVRGQTGNVTISIMLKLTNDRQIDLVQFKAVARLSKIDQDAPAIQEFYVPLFENLVESVTTDLNADVALAKSKIDQAVTETQDIAQVEQAKIQEELPKIQTELSTMNTEVAEAKVKVDELKDGLKLYTAYKMANGDWGTEYPNENLALKSTNYTNTNSFLQYQGVSNLRIENGVFKFEADGSANSRMQFGRTTTTSTRGVDYTLGKKYTVTLIMGTTQPQTSYSIAAKYYPKATTSSFTEVGTLKNLKTTVTSLGSGLYKLVATLEPTSRSNWENESLLPIVYPTADGLGVSATISIYSFKIEEGNLNSPMSINPSEATSVLDYQPMRKGIGFLNSTTESDYTWQFTDEYITYLLSNKADKTELNALSNRVTALEP